MPARQSPKVSVGNAEATSAALMREHALQWATPLPSGSQERQRRRVIDLAAEILCAGINRKYNHASLSVSPDTAITSS